MNFMCINIAHQQIILTVVVPSMGVANWREKNIQWDVCDFFTLYVGFFLSSGWSCGDKIVSIKPGAAASIYWHYRFHRSRRLPTRHLLATVQCREMSRYSIICRTLDLEQFGEWFQSYRILCLFLFSCSVYRYIVLTRHPQIVSKTNIS